MTPYIQQQLKKLCDNPNWYDDMLISWDKNPRNQREAIYNYLSHVQLNGLLENTQIVFTFIDGDMKPAFYFEIPRDTNRYLILGILDEAGYPHCCLLGQPKQMFLTLNSINIMKLTITTLVIVEDYYIQGIFHSLEENPGKAYQELVDQVENEYGYDADKDHVPLHFKTIQDIKDYFELVHIETQELTANGGFKTAILKEL